MAFKNIKGNVRGSNFLGFNVSGKGVQYHSLEYGKLASFSATGGNLANGLQPGNGYTYHTFSTSGSLVVSNSQLKTVECLIVGGGGGGGGCVNNAGSGGAGGGVAYLTSFPLGEDYVTIPVVIGAGGGSGSNVPGGTGTGSSITTPQYNVIAVGGGGGAANQGAAGSNNTQLSQNLGNPYVTNYGNAAVGQGGAGSGTAGVALTRVAGIGTGFSGFEYNLIMPGPEYTSWPGYTNIVPLAGNNDNEYGGGGQGYGNAVYVIGGGARNLTSDAGSNPFPGTNYLGGGGSGGWSPGSVSGSPGGSGVVIFRYLT